MHAKVWSASDGGLVRTLDDHKPMTPQNYPSMLYAVAVSPDGRFIATGDKVGHVAVWDAATGEKAGEVEAPVMYTWDPKQRRHSIGGIRSVAFSRDSALLAVGGIGTIGNIDHLGGPHRIEVFDWQQRERKFEISNDAHKGLVETLEFAPDGRWLAAAGGDNDGFVAFYDMSTGKEIKTEKAPMHVHDFAFDADCTSLLAVGHHKLAAWELTAAKPPEEPLVATKPA
jgi:WD40 repeat protein